MTYTEFLELAISSGALTAEFTPAPDGMVRLNNPIPVKINPDIPNLVPFKHNRVYNVEMFYTDRGKYPAHAFVHSPTRWWPEVLRFRITQHARQCRACVCIRRYRITY